MSLLDDVSIVVTPNGYKAGTLFAVVPVPTEGVEKVTNGDFATDTDWIKGTGWTISGGTASCDGSQTGTSNLYQYTGSLADKIVKMVFTISNYSAGHLDTSFFGASGTTNPRITANGDYTFYISIQSGHNGNTGFSANSSFIGSIDNVSVKEYTAADMDVTRATAATRVDEAGLVNYAEIVGSELAICGDFECASPLTGWTDNAPIGEISIDSGRLKVLNLTNRGRSYRTYTGLTIGKTYEAFVGNTSGDVTGFCHITSGTANNNITLNAPFFFVAGATTAEFQCGVNSTVVNRFTFFDNISLKQNDRDNVPRIDYSGGGCPHILAEPQRTNLVTYSEDFSQSAWVKSGVTLTSNYSTSPDGTLNATRVTGSSSNSLLQSFVYFSNESQTVIVSFYAKGTGKFRIKNTQGNVVDNYSSNYDATSDWERYSYTITNTSSSSGVQIVGIAGNSTGAAYDLSIWGMQLEIGSFPTSIIPTSGSTVTRNQDQFSRDGIGSLINSTEGVLFVEMAAISDDLTRRKITISDGTLSNFCSLYFDSISNKIIGRTTVGGVLQSFLSTSSYTETNFNKVAFKWKVNDFALWVNGSEVGVDSSGVAWGSSVLTEISFDNGTGAENFYGKVKQLQVYKTALTDAQLTSLTS